jgi:transcriptional regulator with XRE-family HTH domain
MTGGELRKARQEAGWTQERLSKRLGVTQAYLSLMERSKRRVPDRVKRGAAALLGLSPTCLPLPVSLRTTDPAKIDVELEQGLARLGYPGLAYRKKPGAHRNPVELLLMALSVDDLDPRLTEALPWLLLRFDGYDNEQLVARAKSLDLQNRLGFTVALARRVAGRNPVFRNRLEELRRLEERLERSRLAREDTYGRKEASERMRAWLRKNRSPEAEHWNLLSDLKAEHLPYGSSNPGPVAQIPAGR